jgi:AAA15 family ATPase/GTPase
MLKNIHIQNFRCFEDFSAEGFERINLIGGKNNSGKTCLLEGIFFGNSLELPQITIKELRDQRNALFDKEYFKNVLYKKNLDVPIIINSNIDSEIYRIETLYPFEKSIVNFPPLNQEGGGFNYHRTIFNINTQSTSGSDKIIKIYNELNENKKNTIFKLIQEILEIEFEQILIKDRNIYILKSSLELPISYYGDALQNIFYYLVIMMSNMGGWDNKIFLIDEIENGIHYSAHQEFWQNIFKLSKELNVQVFATTHSLEMIKAFNEVAKVEGEGAYFEMSREYETGKIFAFKHDTELLEYELEKTTSTIRG